MTTAHHALSIRTLDGDRHQAVCTCGFVGDTWLDREIAEIQAVQHFDYAGAFGATSTAGEEGR